MKKLKFILNPILLTLLGTFLGIFLRDYFLDKKLFELPNWLAIILIISTLLITGIILSTIQDLRDEQKANIESIKSTVKGLQLIDADAGMGLIQGKIENCRYLRIIGVGRQDVIEKFDNKIAKQYLATLESRVKKKEHFVLHRVTGFQFKDYFLKHLEKILEIGGKKGHEIEISLNHSVQSYMTYVIVDDAFLILNVSTKFSEQIKDARLNFFSQNKEIIDGFITHFDEVWKEKKSIKSVKELKEELKKKIIGNTT